VIAPLTGTDQLSQTRAESIQQTLLSWFAAQARDLPWRRTRDPYQILVSEVMLQQTQVDRVLPYFARFLEAFPDVHALANGDTAEVIRLWSGLGYNRRAVNLQRAARAVVDRFGGVFPRDVATLRELPGIGAYTAGAIAAFAFEQDVAFLDTNMRRVINRLLFGTEPRSEGMLLDAAERLVPSGQSWAWNQALIEFGALQCTARRPACVICPLQSECAAFPIVQTDLAVKPSKDAAKRERFETTSRYFRGRIVEVLRSLPSDDEGGITMGDLGPRVREDYSAEHVPWLRALVDGLHRDGLAHVSEDEPAYDFQGEPQQVRVRLP
jgi:A/G-specific adenine glycosylase